MTEDPGQTDDVPSSDSIRAELETYLSQDPSRLGDVFRGLQEQLHAETIAGNLGVSTSNFVWNYSQIIDSLLERELPTAPTMALQAARKYRALLKQNWSQPTRERLLTDLERLERTAQDVNAITEESATARAQTEEVEEDAPTGTYVYALPHYLRYPFDPESGRTLLKVGRSDRDVMQRIYQQSRTTALPEEPVLLRVYPTDGEHTATMESRIHETLRAVDHARSVERVAGREWFLTTTRALDAIAALLGLEPIIVNNDADFLEDV